MKRWRMGSADKLRTQTGQHASHIVGRLSGVSATDSRVEAARKVVETMKMVFGEDDPEVKKAVRMYERAKKRVGS